MAIGRIRASPRISECVLDLGRAADHVKTCWNRSKELPMFIQTETTPNPATLKFLPGREVMGDGGVADFPDRKSAHRSVLAVALFEIPSVSRVFFGSDFISVTKSDGDWRNLKAPILGAIMDHFTRGLAVLESNGAEEDEEHPVAEGDAEIVSQIKELLETRVRPAVANDGGDIVFRGFDGGSGVVFLHLQGSCAGCPSSTLTLKNGIENMLRHYIPEVSAVEAI